jgi:RNA polymerase primary sigma factor
MNEHLTALSRLRRQLRDELGREPTPAELTERLRVRNLPADQDDDDRPREILARVLSSLTTREERVLRMRFGIGTYTDLTLEEIRRQSTMTLERIRQIEAKALKKYKTPKKSSEPPVPDKVPTLDLVKPGMGPRPCGGPANDNTSR